MQHGAILLEHDVEMLVEVLKSGKSKQEFMDEIFSSTTSINNHLGKKIDFYELKTLVLKGFVANLGIILERGNLTYYEYKLKNQLLKEKYQNKEWNLHTSSFNKGSSEIHTQVV